MTNENTGNPDREFQPATCDDCGEQPRLVIGDGYAPFLKCGCGYSDVDSYGLPDGWGA